MDGMGWSDELDVAVTRLTDATFVSSRLADAAGCIAEARAALRALEAEARDAWSRYSVAATGGFHTGVPDPRPALLAWTVRHLRESGYYAPEELERRYRAEADIWAGAEALRLLVTLDALHPVLDALRAGSVRPERYMEAVEAVVSVLVHAHIAR